MVTPSGKEKHISPAFYANVSAILNELDTEWKQKPASALYYGRVVLATVLVRVYMPRYFVVGIRQFPKGDTLPIFLPV